MPALGQTKLTPTVHAEIVTALRQGSYQVVAAQKAGIGRRTLVRWMQRGEMEEARREEGFPADPDEEKYLQFKKDVEIARAQAEVDAVKCVSDAGRIGTWQAAAWYLERSFPQRWGKTREVEEVTDDAEQADPDEALQKLLERLNAVGDQQYEI
jgi:transposase